MPDHVFDTVTRHAGTDRRRVMQTLGAAGIATTLAGAFSASAKQSAGKKAKKKCQKQKQSCLDQVTTFCAQFVEANEAAVCRTELNACCATCDVGAGVICTATLFSQPVVIAGASRNGG